MKLWSKWFGDDRPASEVEVPAREVPLASLRAQVYSERYFGMQLLDRQRAAVRPLAHGLVEALVEDLNGAERTLTWEVVRKLGPSDDELFELGRAQAAAGEQHVASQVVAEVVQVMANNGFYLSGLLLHTFTQQPLPRGVLVVPVSSHHWCLHILNEFSVLQVAPLLEMVAQSVAQEMRVTDAERLATDVYWIHPGGRKMELVPMVGEGTERKAQPSPELARALNL